MWQVMSDEERRGESAKSTAECNEPRDDLVRARQRKFPGNQLSLCNTNLVNFVAAAPISAPASTAGGRGQEGVMTHEAKNPFKRAIQPKEAFYKRFAFCNAKFCVATQNSESVNASPFWSYGSTCVITPARGHWGGRGRLAIF